MADGSSLIITAPADLSATERVLRAYRLVDEADRELAREDNETAALGLLARAVIVTMTLRFGADYAAATVEAAIAEAAGAHPACRGAHGRA